MFDIDDNVVPIFETKKSNDSHSQESQRPNMLMSASINDFIKLQSPREVSTLQDTHNQFVYKLGQY